MTNEGTNLIKSFYLHGTEKQNCVEILILSPGSPTTTLFDSFANTSRMHFRLGIVASSPMVHAMQPVD